MGGLGGLLGGVLGGNNDFQAHTHNVDPNAYMYGGAPGGAAEQQARSAGLAGHYGSAADTGIANSLGARQGQQQYIDQLRMQAAGQGPSAAQAQLQSATNAANANAASFANSARGGPLAQAAAQRQAQGQAADNLQNAGAQSAALRAQEQNAATQALGGALGQQRQQDLSLAGLGAGAQAGYEGQRIQVGEDQLNAGIRQQAQQSENENAAQQLNAQLSNQQADRDASSGSSVLGMAAGAVGALAMSDARVKVGLTPLASMAKPTESANGVTYHPPDHRYEEIGRTSQAEGTRGGSQVLGTAPRTLAEHARALLASDFYLKNQVTPLAQVPSSPPLTAPMAFSDFRLKNQVTPLDQARNAPPMGAPPHYAGYGISGVPTMGGGSAGDPRQVGVSQMMANPSAMQSPRMMWSDENMKAGFSDLQDYSPSTPKAGVSADAGASPAASKSPLASLGGAGGGTSKSKFDEGMSAGKAFGGAISQLGGLLSDKRLKQNVRADEPATDEFMSNLHGYGYHYKPRRPRRRPVAAALRHHRPAGRELADGLEHRRQDADSVSPSTCRTPSAHPAAEGDLYRKHLEDARNIALLKKQVRR